MIVPESRGIMTEQHLAQVKSTQIAVHENNYWRSSEAKLHADQHGNLFVPGDVLLYRDAPFYCGTRREEHCQPLHCNFEPNAGMTSHWDMYKSSREHKANYLTARDNVTLHQRTLLPRRSLSTNAGELVPELFKCVPCLWDLIVNTLRVLTVYATELCPRSIYQSDGSNLSFSCTPNCLVTRTTGVYM
nr:uncharacterized protein LOC127296690 [Lolium perenne]